MMACARNVWRSARAILHLGTHAVNRLTYHHVAARDAGRLVPPRQWTNPSPWPLTHDWMTQACRERSTSRWPCSLQAASRRGEQLPTPFGERLVLTACS